MATRVTTLHTHYDNLKVARDASPAAIDAAYQAMVRRFGPDKHPGDPQAARKMAIVDTSYAVLSNPHQRALHDLWVAQNDDEDTAAALRRPPPSTIPPLWMHSEAPQHYHQSRPLPLPHAPERAVRRHRRSILPPVHPAAPASSHLQRNWSLYALGAVVACLALVTAAPKPFLDDDAGGAAASSGPLRGFSVPVFFAPPRYTRPATAPNGQPWPASAGYVDGYPLLNSEGDGSLTVDNGSNDSDAFVKLVSQGDGQPQVVRHIYVPAYQRFTVDRLAPGRYDLRYRNLASGALARTPAVTVTAAAAPQALPDGGQAPKPAAPGEAPPLTVALYKEPQGKLPALRLAEKEFF
ncbi:DnaJ-class molecular chaperone with C-terminal Zn finger domain containing protein [Acidovorax sp. CF316]|uniref:J domain-containing protein n=1 Tax=Acidovorax sp. CF316 TaxID=1144317 RepID=UPI00026BEF2A|nr:J domain-containing protein [Acidovorax sp. CF316]EJE49707.1 DnaJ-class molecular chaperone with C-terminal Zn finger domain containing protein [Acidovorax sp. CF316]